MRILCQGCGQSLNLGEPAFDTFYQGLPNLCSNCHSPVIISGERLRLELPGVVYARLRGSAKEI